MIITGDHGQSFFEDGAWIHFGPLSEVQTRVPLIMRGPGIPTLLVRRATSHVDLLPTVLHALAGHPLEMARSHGRDLLAGEWSDQA